LPSPFFVLATQNPIEQEGTYPLPEAQQDRFLFLVWVDYPEGEDEMNIIKTVTSESMGEIEPILSGEEIISIQNLLVKIPVPDHVIRYAWKVVRSLRPGKEEALPLANDWIQWGPGPRASINLVKAAKTRAVLNGNLHVSVDDIQAIAHPVLRHRVIPNFGAQAEGYSADRIVDMVLEQIPKDKEV
jgi:MoxR-like ATPase